MLHAVLAIVFVGEQMMIMMNEEVDLSGVEDNQKIFNCTKC